VCTIVDTYVAMYSVMKERIVIIGVFGFYCAIVFNMIYVFRLVC